VEIEAVKPSFQDILVVRKFPAVFPEEIPSMLSLRKMEFCIDLVPGATPISKAPY